LQKLVLPRLRQDIVDDLFALYRVGLDYLKLFIGKLSGLVQDQIGDNYLSKVMQPRRRYDDVRRQIGQLRAVYISFKHSLEQYIYVFSRALDMLSGKLITVFNQVRENGRHAVLQSQELIRPLPQHFGPLAYQGFDGKMPSYPVQQHRGGEGL
jgi:hypothetical protein